MKLSRLMTGLLAVSLMSLMVSDALGQGRRGEDGGRGRGGFGQRGPGGFGGPGRGGPGGGRPGGGGDLNSTMFQLLGVDEVKVEIEVMPDQDEAIGKLMEKLRGERPERPNLNFGEMSEEERREAFAKMREQFEQSQKEREERMTEMREQLEQVLLPGQMDRLSQIAMQRLGLRALEDETVAKKLNVTDQQKKKLAEVRESVGEEMRSKMQEIFQSGDRDAMREAFTKVREETEGKILAVLTSDQRSKFEEMKGEEFEMPEGGRGGFGGPGGGRGPGGFGGRGGRGGPGGDDGGRRPARPEAE